MDDAPWRVISVVYNKIDHYDTLRTFIPSKSLNSADNHAVVGVIQTTNVIAGVLIWNCRHNIRCLRINPAADIAPTIKGRDEVFNIMMEEALLHIRPSILFAKKKFMTPEAALLMNGTDCEHSDSYKFIGPYPINIPNRDPSHYYPKRVRKQPITEPKRTKMTTTNSKCPDTHQYWCGDKNDWNDGRLRGSCLTQADGEAKKCKESHQAYVLSDNWKLRKHRDRIFIK